MHLICIDEYSDDEIHLSGPDRSCGVCRGVSCRILSMRLD